MGEKERTIILVKAWPQPSQKYGETVCCAGVTIDKQWRRLFPIRFRHLSGDTQFNRWDIVEYQHHPPNDDRRIESRRVDEPTLKRVGAMPPKERAQFFAPLLKPSASAAASEGASLALVRPTRLKFRHRRKTDKALLAERQKRDLALAQGSLWEKELAKIEPCPYNLSLEFTDANGDHQMACGDWETAATFFRFSREYGEQRALDHLRSTYEDEYMKKGVVLALGTVKKRPQQWLLLGIIRLDVSDAGSLF